MNVCGELLGRGQGESRLRKRSSEAALGRRGRPCVAERERLSDESVRFYRSKKKVCGSASESWLSLTDLVRSHAGTSWSGLSSELCHCHQERPTATVLLIIRKLSHARLEVRAPGDSLAFPGNLLRRSGPPSRLSFRENRPREEGGGPAPGVDHKRAGICLRTTCSKYQRLNKRGCTHKWRLGI